MLKLLLADTQSGLHETIFREIKNMGTENARFLLVPNESVYDTDMRLCQAVDSKPVCKVITFHKLYDQVCAHDGGGAIPFLTQNERELLMYKAFCSSMQNLNCYHSRADLPVFLKNLLALSDECKRDRIEPCQLRLVSSQVDGLLNKKLQDTALILETYNQLVIQDRPDPQDKLTLLAQYISHGCWPSNSCFWVDGFQSFTPQELEVFSQLLHQGNELFIFLADNQLTSEGDSGFTFPSDVSLQLKKVIEQLTEIAKDTGTDIEIQARQNIEKNRDMEMAFLKENLFAPQRQEWNGSDPNITVLTSDSLRKEVEFAASKILELVREKNLRFQDFIITARHFGQYADLVEDVFGKYGIPVCYERQVDISESPVLQLIAAALDIVTGNYQYEDLFRYLKAGLSGLSDNRVDQLENYAYTWNLSGQCWKNKKEKKDKKNENEWNMPPDGSLDPDASPNAEAVKILQEINKDRDNITAPLDDFVNHQNKTGHEYIAALMNLIQAIDLENRLEELSADALQNDRPELCSAYENQWNTLIGAIEQFDRLMGSQKMDLDEFSLLFKLMLTSGQKHSVPRTVDQVISADIERIPPRRTQYLIILGAVEGTLPDTDSTAGIFNDHEREILAGEGLVLGVPPLDKMPYELSLIYRACAIPEKGLLVTWTQRAEDTAEPRQPSLLIRELISLFGAGIQRNESIFGVAKVSESSSSKDKDASKEAENATLETDKSDKMEEQDILPGADYTLSKETVKAVYRIDESGHVPVSATWIQNFQSCRYSHFMQNGIHAKKRQRVELGAAEYGSYIHAILKYILENHADGSQSADIKALAIQATDQHFNKFFEKMAYIPPKVRRYFSHTEGTAPPIVKDMLKIFTDIVEESDKSDFDVWALERDFGKSDETVDAIPPINVSDHGITLAVSGKIDRIDLLRKNGRQYFLVIDYKTGKDSFIYTDVNEGVLIQLPLYQLALKGQTIDDLPVENAGMRYIHVRRADKKETAESAEFDDDLEIWDGLILDDNDSDIQEAFHNTVWIDDSFKVSAEKLDLLSLKVTDILKKIAADLAREYLDISPHPYYRSIDNKTKDVCTYCDFKQICHSSMIPTIEKHKVKKVTSENFWKDLKDEFSGEVKS